LATPWTIWVWLGYPHSASLAVANHPQGSWGWFGHPHVAKPPLFGLPRGGSATRTSPMAHASGSPPQVGQVEGGQATPLAKWWQLGHSQRVWGGFNHLQAGQMGVTRPPPRPNGGGQMVQVVTSATLFFFKKKKSFFRDILGRSSLRNPRAMHAGLFLSKKIDSSNGWATLKF
jgi:hypothetical protein